MSLEPQRGNYKGGAACGGARGNGGKQSTYCQTTMVLHDRERSVNYHNFASAVSRRSVYAKVMRKTCYLRTHLRKQTSIQMDGWTAEVRSSMSIIRGYFQLQNMRTFIRYMRERSK